MQIQFTTIECSQSAGYYFLYRRKAVVRMEDMTEKELITVLIDKYTDLQRIKRANNGGENQELEYQIKVTIAKLASLGVSVEDITL